MRSAVLHRRCASSWLQLHESVMLSGRFAAGITALLKLVAALVPWPWDLAGVQECKGGMLPELPETLPVCPNTFYLFMFVENPKWLR